jgi:hypothetical protein
MMVVEVNDEEELGLSAPTMLFERDLSVGRLQRLYSFGTFDVAPDGQSFAVIDDSHAPDPPVDLVLVQNFDQDLKRLVPTN